ncbi:MAG TPA: TrmH family RNA methyltransferase [Magnetospirillaceae bacterium]|nr:TrmH family RNA methyltransferase [Magnetospirillaceae bacterium]
MEIIVIAHNIRSTHNIGAILRTCDGFGVIKVYCTGYTPYPTLPGDKRLPHLRDKITKHIHKTALGAEASVPIEQADEVQTILDSLKTDGFQLIALEQDPKSVALPKVHLPQKIALLLGEEVNGIPPNILAQCDTIIEIPMRGTKESFNVSVAAGIALYALSI